MKTLTVIFVLIFIVSGCRSEQNKDENVMNSQKAEPEIRKEEAQDFPYLKDTIKISGKTILILRPDSLRFQSYLNSGEEWIYEVDSDFGFGVSTALDSVNFDEVIESVTEKRFIEIVECKGCPKLIDRDTIDYGYILSRPGKEIEIQANIVFGAVGYIQSFENYFNE